MKYFWLISTLILTSNAFAWNDMLCERKPNAVIVKATKTGGCSAELKIQAIAYECGEVSNNADFTRASLAANIEKAREKCLDYCEDLGKNCTGHFEAPSICGLAVPGNRASSLGKGRINCPTTCKGRAFNYCSIYHGNFLSTDAALFEGMKPNCRCHEK